MRKNREEKSGKIGTDLFSRTTAPGFRSENKSVPFFSRGLSGNGAALAKQHGIKWYSLERMNEWISNVVQSEYAGPQGDILSHLEKLMVFIGQISTPLPYGRKWRGYR